MQVAESDSTVQTVGMEILPDPASPLRSATVLMPCHAAGFWEI
jgi:hypothetical protein